MIGKIRVSLASLSAMTLIGTQVGVGFISFLRSMYMANRLTPDEFGSYGIIFNILTYAPFLELGVSTGLLYEVPKLVGAGKELESEDILTRGMSTVILKSIVLCLGFLLASLFVQDPYFSQILILFGLTTTVGISLNVAIVLGRIRERFVLLSVASFSGSVACLLLTYGVGSNFNANLIPLLICAWLASSMLSLGILFFGLRPKFKWPNERITWFSNIKKGFFPSLIPLSSLAFFSVDRWTGTYAENKDVVGYFVLAATIGFILIALPQALTPLLTRKLNKAIGAGSQPFVQIARFLSTLSLVHPFVVVSASLAIPLLLNLFYKNYVPGTFLIQMQLLAFLPLFPIALASEYFVSLGKSTFIIGFYLVNALLKFFIVKSLIVNFSPEAGAIAIMLYNTFFGATILTLCLLNSGNEKSSLSKDFLLLALPSLVFTGSFLILQYSYKFELSVQYVLSVAFLFTVLLYLLFKFTYSRINHWVLKYQSIES